MNKQQKFQIILALIVFILTIISSIIAGYLVYQLTLDEEPYLVITPYRNIFNGTFSIQIANIKENPALMIQIYYQLEGSPKAFAGEIPYLDKGNNFVILNQDKLDAQIKVLCEKKLKEINALEYDIVEINQLFDVLLTISCNNCNDKNVLKINDNINYARNLECYINNKHEIIYEWKNPHGIFNFNY